MFFKAPERLQQFRKHLPCWLTVPLAATLWRRPRSAFGILMYHRVTNPVAGVEDPTWNVPPDRLREQLSGLLQRGFEPWHLSKVLDALERGEPIPRRVFVVTFDDGYANNLTQAYPILKELTVPATVFLATAYLNSRDPFPNDDWSGIGSASVPAEAWRPLTTAECHELRADGLIELAAHTHRHLDFRGAPDQLQADLEHCCAVLRNEFGIVRPTFAFPYGTRSLGFSGPPLLEAARAAGVRCALTTEAQLVQPGDDPFDWGRHLASDRDTAATLAAKLSGWYEWVRDIRRNIKAALHGIPPAQQVQVKAGCAASAAPQT